MYSSRSATPVDPAKKTTASTILTAPESSSPYRAPSLRSDDDARQTVGSSSSSECAQAASPYSITQQRRVDFAKRETEQKFSFVFLSPDESLGDSEDATAANGPGTQASLSLLDDPDFVNAACDTLLAVEPQLPRLSSALGMVTAQHPNNPEAQREAQINVYLRAIQHHLPALLTKLARRRTNSLASNASNASTASTASASSTRLPAPSNQPAVSSISSTSSTDTASASSTASMSPWSTPTKKHASWNPEQAFHSKVQRRAPEILTEKFGPLLLELKSVLEKPENRAKHGDAAFQSELSMFTLVSTLLMDASRCAAAGQSSACREALKSAVKAAREFRSEHLPPMIRLFPGGSSPLPGRAERAFKEKLDDMASQIEALLDEPVSAMREFGRDRAASSPMSPQRPKAALAVRQPGAQQVSDNPLSAARLRFFSANARSPRKLAREPANQLRASDRPVDPPGPQTTAAANAYGALSTASASAPPTPAVSAAPRMSAKAPPSPRGVRREKRDD